MEGLGIIEVNSIFGIIGLNNMTQKIKIPKGSNRPIELQILTLKNGLVAPRNLEGVTEITACLMKDDGTDLIKTFSGAGGIEVVSETAGQIKILLSTADTESLQAVEGGSFELKIIDPEITDVLQFKRSLFVIESEC